MITGQIKNQIDQIWDTFWTGGISNSIDILEQMTYLFFMKLLDDKQLNQEATAAIIGQKVCNPTFGKGNWHNPDQDRDVPFDDLRWSRFKNFEPTRMFQTVSQDVFSFIKHLNSGKESAYSRFMESAIFLIQSPRNLVKIVEGINSLDMNNRDTMGDVYEHILGKMAASGNNGQFRTPRHIIRMMVDMMKPTLDDTICDPAMGSAGFIDFWQRYCHIYSSMFEKKQALGTISTTFDGGLGLLVGEEIEVEEPGEPGGGEPGGTTPPRPTKPGTKPGLAGIFDALAKMNADEQERENEMQFWLAQTDALYSFLKADGKFMAMLRSENFTREQIEKEYHKLIRRFLRQTEDAKVKKLIDENKEMFLEEFKEHIATEES